MAEHNSSQRAKLIATPAGFIKANELGARLRPAYFDFTVPAGNAAIADTVNLVLMRKGWRLFGGWFANEAMTTGAGAATMELGIAGAVAKYLAATSVDAAGQGDFGHTVALNFGEELTAEAMLIATVSVEAWAAAARLFGALWYAEG